MDLFRALPLISHDEVSGRIGEILRSYTEIKGLRHDLRLDAILFTLESIYSVWIDEATSDSIQRLYVLKFETGTYYVL